MKKSCFLNINTFILLWALALTSQTINAAIPIGVNTKGYTSGRLSTVSLERSFNTTYVGELLLGHDSITFISLGNNKSLLPISNPWRFCFNERRYKEIEALIGRNVVLEFKTPKSNSLLSCSAAHELVAIYPVDKDHALEQTRSIGNSLITDPETASGVDFGRITNVIENKSTIRDYFMTIQIGNGGNQFRNFIMNDPDLFNFAVNCLKTAAMVRIHYSERYSFSNRFGTPTLSYVMEIEVVD